MENDRKKCNLCKQLQRFFKKGSVHFSKTDYGFCYRHKKIVYVKDTCDNFEYGSRRHILNKHTRYYLDKLLLEISALRCIIEEQTRDLTDE